MRTFTPIIILVVMPTAAWTASFDRGILRPSSGSADGFWHTTFIALCGHRGEDMGLMYVEGLPVSAARRPVQSGPEALQLWQRQHHCLPEQQ